MLILNTKTQVKFIAVIDFGTFINLCVNLIKCHFAKSSFPIAGVEHSFKENIVFYVVYSEKIIQIKLTGTTVLRLAAS